MGVTLIIINGARNVGLFPQFSFHAVPEKKAEMETWFGLALIINTGYGLYDTRVRPKTKKPDLKAGKGGHMVVRQDGELVHKGFEVVQQIDDADPVPGHLGGVSWADSWQTDRDKDKNYKSFISLRVLYTISIYKSIGRYRYRGTGVCFLLWQRCTVCFVLKSAFSEKNSNFWSWNGLD